MLTFIADKIAYDPTARDVSYHLALFAAQDTASLPDLYSKPICPTIPCGMIVGDSTPVVVELQQQLVARLHG
jgi:hypothetical protein